MTLRQKVFWLESLYGFADGIAMMFITANYMAVPIGLYQDGLAAIAVIAALLLLVVIAGFFMEDKPLPIPTEKGDDGIFRKFPPYISMVLRILFGLTLPLWNAKSYWMQEKPIQAIFCATCWVIVVLGFLGTRYAVRRTWKAFRPTRVPLPN